MRWLAATLVGLLALSWALITISSPGVKVNPAPDDREFAGTALLAGFLRDRGFRVGFDPAEKPKLGATDVLIVPVLGERRIPEPILQYVRQGGRAFVIGVPDTLQSVTEPIVIEAKDGKKVKVDNTESSTPQPEKPEGQLASTDVWRIDEDVIATFKQIGKGRMVVLNDGALATNRFLGRAENAKLVDALLAPLFVKKGERTVFVVGGYRDAEALGPIEAIGSGAVGALWQSLAVLAAFGVTRGFRFGLSAPDGRVRRGSRDLLDVVAAHYRRGKRTDAPLAMVARERPNDVEMQGLAARPKVAEEVARRALIEAESRPRVRR